ncbi:LysR family transcriptional regulator [Thalassospira marina]|uniref:Transcriptional regulator n=1 Tax=Thalassospira marina TaxID=2048283 RepID=A0A2N3KX14_9PROT|nr:LysR family transcriptional regulator [Thalassospira marina]PKR55023.1 transcriptional regulator [Thalassospira marina]
MDRLAAMETFVLVVDTGSFSAAARRLNVGQPAVSKTIAQLESRLGVKLLARSTRGLAATEAGMRFYDRAHRSIAEADEADIAARGAGKGLSGRLRICAAVTFARLHLVPHLPAFLARHPDIEMDVILDDRHIDVVQEGIDVGLRMGILEDSALTARRIASGRQVVLATPDYLAHHGTPQTPADLEGHDAVIYSQQDRGRFWVFENGGREVPVRLQGRLKLTAAEGVRAAVMAHAGLAIATDWMFAPEIASGDVRILLPDWQLPQIDLWTVFPAGRAVSTKARIFASFVEEIMNAPVAR